MIHRHYSLFKLIQKRFRAYDDQGLFNFSIKLDFDDQPPSFLTKTVTTPQFKQNSEEFSMNRRA